MAMGGKRWTYLLLCISFLLLLPLAGPLKALVSPGSAVWQHFYDTLLWNYTRDTIVLGLGTVILATVLGLVPAWLLSRYSLPMASFLEVALILPLALPPYIIAYAYSGIFDFYGPIWQLGNALGFSHEFLNSIQITNMPGLIMVMSYALSPYVFIIMRSSFRFRVAVPLEAARSLGAGEFRQFFGLSLPLCRPALAGALSIVLMDTLNEYGAVSYFGQNTLSTGIFRTWFAHYDLPAAQRLAGYLLLIVFVILAIERALHGRRSYEPGKQIELEKIPCSPRKGGLFFVIALIPFIFGFLLPIGQILAWVFRELPGSTFGEVFQGTLNTLSLTVIAGVILTILGIFVSYAQRMEGNFFVQKLSDLSLLGHSLPGSVIALGMFGISQGMVNLGFPIILTGSIFLIIYAYTVRFLALSQRSIASTMSHQLKGQDEASRSLGRGPMQTLLRIHLPNLKSPITAALAIISLEIIKELPLTIILRPFNFQTLAVRSYQLASSELVQAASIPALVLVSISLLAVLIFRRSL